MTEVEILKEMLVEAEKDISNTRQWLMEELENPNTNHCIDNSDDEWRDYKDALSRYATIEAILERIEDEQ